MRTHTSRGFTLSEILIVVALIAILFLAVMVNWRRQIDRGYDALRKKHLSDIKRAFEEYYNDKNCYPSVPFSVDFETILSHCGGPELQPYLQVVPCDPIKRTPYTYISLDPDGCSGYRVLAALEDTSDPDIVRIGCSVGAGCGYGPTYNYGISSGAPVLGSGPPIGGSPTPTLTPTVPPTSAWACTPDGLSCNYYADPVGNGCPVTFSSSSCDNQCGDPANRCAQ